MNQFKRNDQTRDNNALFPSPLCLGVSCEFLKLSTVAATQAGTTCGYAADVHVYITGANKKAADRLHVWYKTVSVSRLQQWY